MEHHSNVKDVNQKCCFNEIKHNNAHHFTKPIEFVSFLSVSAPH